MRISMTVLLAGVVAALVGVASVVAEDDYSQIANYDFGQEGELLASMEKKILEAKGRDLCGIESGLLSVLETKDGTFAGKQFACRMLRAIGTEKSLPVLAKLLTDEKLSHMARYALEGMKDGAVDKALLEAMRESKGAVKVGLIGSIGVRGDENAIPVLGGLLSDDDEAVAGAAIDALGRIGSEDAAKALGRGSVSDGRELHRADAYLKCLDAMVREGKGAAAAKIYRRLYDRSELSLVRVAALRGLAAADAAQAVPLLLGLLASGNEDLRAAARASLNDAPGFAVATGIADVLLSSEAQQQVVLLDVLAARKDAGAARGPITELAGSQDLAVRVAALRCLGVVGDESALAPLVGALTAGGDARDVAKGSLVVLRGNGVNQAILRSAKAADAAERIALIDILARRQSRDATPSLLEWAGGEDRGLSDASFQAIGVLAGDDAVPLLIALLKKVDGGGSGAARDALRNVCARSRDRDACVGKIVGALPNANDKARSSMLAVLGQLGGASALKALAAAAKDDNKDVSTAAVRALSESRDVSAMPVLLELAKDGADEIHRVLALRGYIRLLGVKGKRPDDETVKLYGDAISLATRADEKKLAFGGLGHIEHRSALEMVTAGLDDEACNAEAAAAAVPLAGKLGGKHKELAKSAMQKVLETSKHGEMRKRAQDLLNKLAGK